MAKREYNWMWRRLAAQSAPRRQRQARAVELRGDPTKRDVRDHTAYPTTPALDRFLALTERVLVGDDTCVVWRGGETFRVDDDTVTTPARFYWQIVHGPLSEDEILWKACKTASCVKHKRLVRKRDF